MTTKKQSKRPSPVTLFEEGKETKLRALLGLLDLVKPIENETLTNPGWRSRGNGEQEEGKDPSAKTAIDSHRCPSVPSHCLHTLHSSHAMTCRAGRCRCRRNRSLRHALVDGLLLFSLVDMRHSAPSMVDTTRRLRSCRIRLRRAGWSKIRKMKEGREKKIK